MFRKAPRENDIPRPSHTQERTKDKYDVLIAEDSPTQAAMLEHILSKRGFRVESARSGKDALHYLEELQADKSGWPQFRPDIIVSDIVMPYMDGFEFCERLKAHAEFQSIPLILLTSLNDSREALRGLYSGADNLLAKPYDEGNLVATVEMMLNTPASTSTAEGEPKFGINMAGHKYMVSESRLRMINVIYTTYETAVRKNRELDEAQTRVRDLERQLAIAHKALADNGVAVEDLAAQQVLLDQY